MTNHMPNVRDLLSSLRKAGWYITAFELHYNKHDYVVVFEDAAHLNKNKQYFSASLTFYDIHDPNRVLSDVYAHTSKLATVYKGNIIKNLIMDCQSYTKYRPNETTGGIFVSWRRKEELPTGA